MACTKTVSDSITWVSSILGNQPFGISGFEPGLTFANITLQRMVGPPMKWRQNRGLMSFPVSAAGGVDYPVQILDLGWIENSWLATASGDIQALELAEDLPRTTLAQRPTVYAPVYDDNQGNITFRLNSIPNFNDTVFFDYQRKAAPMLSFGAKWNPIPDEYGYVYNKLLLAICGNLVRDARWQQWSQEGISALLGAQQGLSAQAVAIFLYEWDRYMTTLASSQNKTKLASAAQGR